MMKTTLEKEVEARLVAGVRKRGGRCLKFVSPGNSGVPDRIILMPHGVVVFAELKRPKGGKISELQKLWRDRFAALGLWMVFVFDYAAVDTLLLNLDDMVSRRRGYAGF